MVAIPWPLSSAPGVRAQEGAGRLINAFAEPLGDTARSQAVYRRAPGLSLFATTADTTFRGAILVNTTLYVALAGSVVSITSGGVVTVLTGGASMAGTDRVFFARNNAATPNIVAVCTAGPFTIAAGAVSAYSDPNIGSPNSVTFQDGYFFFSYGNGKCQASNLNATSLNTLNSTTSQAKPGGLLRAISFRDSLVLFGSSYTEWYSDTANPTGFPFTRAAWIPRGLSGYRAIAGHEDGFGKALLWVADDNTVVQMNGYGVDKVSPPDLDRLIEAVSDKSTLEASVYITGGHAMWQLSSADWTWVFNLNNQKWHERQSFGLSRSRMTGGVSAFSKWLCGDTQSGQISEISDAVYNELGTNLRYEVQSGPVDAFPSKTRVARADFQVSTGVGIATSSDPTVIDPKAQISWSDNGGVNWSNPVFRSLGKQGETKTKITLTRTGLTKSFGRRWRFVVDDPVYAGLMQGDQSAELRAG